MESFAHPISEQLRGWALALPETSEGTSCVNRAFRARAKNFLFVGEKPEGIVRVMLKLDSSLPRAEDIAARDERVRVGKGGWVTLEFPAADPLDGGMLHEWLRESFRVLAPKALVKEMDPA